MKHRAVHRNVGQVSGVKYNLGVRFGAVISRTETDGELNAVCERAPTVHGQNRRAVRAYDLPIPYLFLSLTCVQLSLIMSFNCHLSIRRGLLGVYRAIMHGRLRFFDSQQPLPSSERGGRWIEQSGCGRRKESNRSPTSAERTGSFRRDGK